MLSEADIYKELEKVKDPEIPSISIVELGIVRGVLIANDNVTVSITPTYAGCPAMDVIRDEIKATLAAAGIIEVEIKTVLSPAWTTDWLSDEAKIKLQNAGIAPPEHKASDLVQLKKSICCPKCGSRDTVCKSEFGATPCKTMWQCNNCLEPFEYLKPF